MGKAINISLKVLISNRTRLPILLGFTGKGFCAFGPSRLLIDLGAIYKYLTIQIEHLFDPLNDVLSDEKVCDVLSGISSSGIKN